MDKWLEYTDFILKIKARKKLSAHLSERQLRSDIVSLFYHCRSWYRAVVLGSGMIFQCFCSDENLILPSMILPFETMRVRFQILLSLLSAKRSPYHTKLSSPRSKVVMLVFLRAYLCPRTSTKPH